MATAIGKDLIDRRVPQYLAVYLGVSWGVVQFFAFMEDRYFLSPHLTNLVLLLVVLLLPSAAMFFYFHGSRGTDRWRRIEKIFIPLNVAVTALILLTGFSGKELGAVTTTVTVEDEEGNEIARTVAKSEFRKSLLLFPLAADSTDEGQAWLGFGVLSGLANDLFQDVFVDARHPGLFRDRLRDEGFQVAGSVPRPLKRKIAQDLNVPYFLEGSAGRDSAGYRFTLALHDAERGRVVHERIYEGDDLLALIDAASLQLRHDLELPARHIEESQDLPVRDHTTGSIEAFRDYALATQALFVRDDYAGARVALERAVAADPTFADAGLALYQVLLFSGDAAGATAALSAVMDHLYRLPERTQYVAKAEWYAMQQDWQKSFAVHEMWAELYPQDIQAQLSVAQMRLLQDDRAGAIEALERVVTLDPTRLDMVHRIGTLYEAVGEPDRARTYFERFRNASPEDTRGLTSLAGLERRAGDHEAARELYERALLLEPGDVVLTLALAGLDRDIGAFDAALAGYEDALARSKTAEQRFEALMGLRRFHDARGSAARALELQERAMVEGQSFQPPVSQIQLRLLGLTGYVEAGRGDEALQMLDGLAAQLPPPLDALVPIGRIGVFEALERPEELAAAIAEGETMMERTGIKFLEQPIIYGRGRLHEMRGEWREAIAAYEAERTADPTDATIPAQIGRCYRELGELGRAEELLKETLRALPAHGRTHYELALVYERMDRRTDAIHHLDRALEVWAPADPTFEWARAARERRRALGG